MEFLYPRSKQFPFDAVCTDIVDALQQRNWQVPGVEVKFHEYGSGDQKFRAVSTITGFDFRLHFSRIQRTMPGGRWNDTAAVTQIVIPRKEIHVYEDESGPTFYLYVGDNWERDREKFMNGSKVNSKLYNNPRMYLEYKGECNCRGAGFDATFSSELLITMLDDVKHFGVVPHNHTGRRPPLLVHTNDLGREYDLEGDEPYIFSTARIFEEFRQYLANIVLKMIVSYPIPEKVIGFAEPEPVAFPESIGPLFCFAEHDDEWRITKGKKNAEQLEPADRYGMNGNGYRLMPLGTSNDGTVPEVAYDGFLWCGIGDVTTETAIDSLEVPGHTRWSDHEKFVIRLKPNRANDIYIADHAKYEKERASVVGASVLEGRKRLTDAEVAMFVRARARTIVPISEYAGGYEQPVVLINRELSFDEVDVVSGPHKARFQR